MSILTLTDRQWSLLIEDRSLTIRFIVQVNNVSGVFQLRLQLFIFEYFIEFVDIIMEHLIESGVMMKIVKVNLSHVSESATVHHIQDDVTLWSLVSEVMKLFLSKFELSFTSTSSLMTTAPFFPLGIFLVPTTLLT